MRLNIGGRSYDCLKKIVLKGPCSPSTETPKCLLDYTSTYLKHSYPTPWAPKQSLFSFIEPNKIKNNKALTLTCGSQ